MTCLIWRPSLFCCIKSKQHGHVEVSFYLIQSRVIRNSASVDSLGRSFCTGISFKTQALYVGVFVTRYLDLFYHYVSLYNSVMKLFFIASSCYILYLMKIKYRSAAHHYSNPFWPVHIFRPTHDPSIDTFKIEYILAPCLILSLLFNYKFSFSEILWSFSIWLEAVAILPQLFMLQRTGEAETITTHYLAALGAYRALYIPNWIFRFIIYLQSHVGLWCCNVNSLKTRVPD